jgi:hypothetical protein
MSFTTLKTKQIAFLEKHLRGTGRSISEVQAESLYGIRNLRARITELRKAGLVVRTNYNSVGRLAYSISRRDVSGSQGRIFS